MGSFVGCDLEEVLTLKGALYHGLHVKYMTTPFYFALRRSNELEILKLLNAFQPMSEHIIPLRESFQTQSTPWAILPEMNSIFRNGVCLAHLYPSLSNRPSRLMVPELPLMLVAEVQAFGRLLVMIKGSGHQVRLPVPTPWSLYSTNSTTMLLRGRLE